MFSTLQGRSTSLSTDGFVAVFIFISMAVIACVVHSAHVYRRRESHVIEELNEQTAPAFSEAVLAVGSGLEWRNIIPLSAALIRVESIRRPCQPWTTADPQLLYWSQPRYPKPKLASIDEPLEAQVAVIIAMPCPRPYSFASYDVGVAHITIPWEAGV